MAEFIKVYVIEDGKTDFKKPTPINVDKINFYRKVPETLTIYKGDTYTVNPKEFPVWIETEFNQFVFSKLSMKEFEKALGVLEEQRLTKIAEKISRFNLMDMEEE